MLCPRCSSGESIVTDTRASGKSGIPYGHVRRRRKCLNCSFRFTTYEIVEEPDSITAKRLITTLRRIKMLVEDVDLEV